MNKLIKITLLFFATFLTTISLNAQDTTVVETAGNEFAPAGVIIEQGNYVKWVNTSQGLHNVVADDGSFDSGDPSTARWEYVVQFNTIGFYNYYCEIHGGPGATGMSGFVQVEEPTSVEDENIQNDFRLEQNYPNPFNPTTSISFNVPQTSEVKLTIFDLLGNEITTLVNDVKTIGKHSVEWTADNLSSGIYMYKLEAVALDQQDNFVQAKKMILMK